MAALPGTRIKLSRLRIRTRMMLVFLGLPVISLIIFGYFAFSDIQKMGNYALDSSTLLSNSATSDSTKALESLGEKIIAQKAADVALQCRIFLNAHPGISLKTLKKKTTFEKIAVQSVGKTGYTILYDKNGIMRYHPNPELNDYDMHNWKEKLPGFWNIFEKTFGGSPASGYYEWQDQDGKIRRKFMSIVPVTNTPFMIAATTYIDEFSIPVKETEEKIASATGIINDQVNEKIQNIRISFIIFLIILIMVVFSVSYLLSKTITDPIMTLIEGVRAIGRGEIDHRVRISTEDEFEDLAVAFNRMASDLKEQMVKLERTTADKEGLLKEMDIARGIQKRLLPDNAPPIEGITIAAHNIPAREVSGDFYDFIPVMGGNWGIVIADVSGKGMPAAIFMGLSRTIVRASAAANLRPSQTIRQANELICRDSTSGMFVTVFYAVLDPSRKIHYINAGHNPPLFFKSGAEEPHYLKTTKGIALGVKQNIDLNEEEIEIDSGDLLILYTDGVTEAINNTGDSFGIDRLIKVTRRNRHRTPGEILKAIETAVIDFAGGQPQFDDITLVIIKAD